MPKSPLYELKLQRLPADQSLERREPRLVLLDKVRCPRVVVERARLVLANPDPDQVARNAWRFASPCSVSPARNSWAT